MIRFITSRLLQMVVVLFILSVVTFSLMKLAPGDPVRFILKVDEVVTTSGEQEQLREKLGFNDPVWKQYITWLGNVTKLDFGTSYISNESVVYELSSRFGPTISLALSSLGLTLLFAFVLGGLAALNHQRFFDHLSRIIAFAGASIPNFLVALLLIYFFSMKLRILPAMGNGSVLHFLLPSVTLGFGMSAVYARLLRASLLDSLQQEYIRGAHARGIPPYLIFFCYALPPALLPVLTMFGMSFGLLFGGTVVVETIFSWPGLGQFIVDSIMKRDYPVIQGFILLTGFFVMSINLCVDLLYAIVDPKVRLAGRSTK